MLSDAPSAATSILLFVRFSLRASAALTSVVFAFNARAAFTSVVFAFNARALFVAKELKSWSPVLVPVIAASFVFSAVV